MNMILPIREGVPIAIADEAVAAGRPTAAELDRLAIPRKTLAHRRTPGRLTPEQSDRLVHILRLVSAAEECLRFRPAALGVAGGSTSARCPAMLRAWMS